MTQNLAIQVEKLSKRYSLGTSHSQHDTFRDLLVDRVKKLIHQNGQSQAHSEAFWALKDATFAIERGENVGIIGLNGAGKSTLLKILSRITEPTEGTAQIAGRMGALLEVGTGFHGELTGRENVYLYGAILGMSKAEITRKFDTIVGFAEIKDFIDTPVKRYSSGMYVRLAFAVAAHMEPEILLLDEVLSVGDLTFQRKCMNYTKELQRRKATIVYVSHNMFSIKTMCSRVIYLKHGRIQYDGPIDEGIKLYEDDCRFSVPSWAEKEKKHSEWPILVTDIALHDEGGRAKTVFDHGERMTVRIHYKALRVVDNPNFIVAFIRSDLQQACVYSTETDGMAIDRVNGEGVIELQTPPLKLTAELYTIHIVVREKGFLEMLCAQVGSSFHVRHDLFNVHFGMFHESGRWLWEGRSGSGEVA